MGAQLVFERGGAQKGPHKEAKKQHDTATKCADHDLEFVGICGCNTNAEEVGEIAACAGVIGGSVRSLGDKDDVHVCAGQFFEAADQEIFDLFFRDAGAGCWAFDDQDGGFGIDLGFVFAFENAILWDHDVNTRIKHAFYSAQGVLEFA